MIRKVKDMYYRWLNRGVVAQSCVYLVVSRPNEESPMVTINSIHKNFKSAQKGLERIAQPIRDEYHIERYGLWN